VYLVVGGVLGARLYRHERECTGGGVPLWVSRLGEGKELGCTSMVEVCACVELTKGKELGYEFSEIDDSGHRWYSLGKTLYVATASSFSAILPTATFPFLLQD